MAWTRFFRRRYWDEERSRELDTYLQIETDENIARGMPPDHARSAALKKLGNPTLVREESTATGFICMSTRRAPDSTKGASTLSITATATNGFDYPLSSRFDETDSFVVCDNVFIPWEHVFIYRNLEICRDQWW